MDLTSPTIIKELLQRHGASPSKTMGQNFLIDKKKLASIIEAGELTKQDTVLEVGPGIGVLTSALAENAGNVISIEKDYDMVEILRETTKEYLNLKVVNEDILKLSISNFQLSNYKLIANIPYYITSPIIRKFLEEKYQPSVIILMVQKEVAQRMCAKPPNMSLLAVSVQFYAKPQIISYVSKACFWPKPNVDSAIIKITPHKNPPTVLPDTFFKIVKAGFSHPRKQLLNNFSVELEKPREQILPWLEKNGIEPKRRAETLLVQDWINLAQSFQ